MIEDKKDADGGRWELVRTIATTSASDLVMGACDGGKM
jgi:hypothetical protein